MSHVVRDVPPVGVPRRSLVEHVRAGDMARRIVVDGVVRAERITQEVNTFTLCLLKAA
jgi:hypothetical protein